MKFTLILAFLAAAIAYELPDCTTDPDHSWCLDRVNPVITLTAADVAKFVDTHNAYRAGTAATGGAVDMQSVSWSEDLATEAGNWASQCGPSHEPDSSNRHFGTYKIGQNVFSGYSSQWDFVNDQTDRLDVINRAVDLWYNEIQDYHYDTNTCNTGKVCGHYTQVVWHDSALIGCAFAVCPPTSGYDVARVVCNYAHAGNWVGEKPYALASSNACGTSGEACCPGLVCEHGTIDLASCTCNCDVIATGPTCSELVTGCGNFVDTLTWCGIIGVQSTPAGVTNAERERYWCNTYSNVQSGCMNSCCNWCAAAPDECTNVPYA